jgi:hypothetical protein
MTMTLQLSEPAFTDFCRFAKGQIDSGDLDPTYPVLRAFYDSEELPEEIRLWRTLLYVTWYNLHSAEQAWTAHPEPREIRANYRLPTGTERRAFRGNDLAAHHVNHLLASAQRAGGLRSWVLQGVGRGDKAGWDGVRTQFQSIPYGGPWSSYKWADLLKSVHRYPITASDIGVGGGGETAGPVPGLVRLTGLPWKRVSTDVELQQAVHDAAVARGVPFNGLDMLETACCDFNSLCKGSYYVGHDVDVQQEYLANCSEGLKAARMKTFAPQYLGELGGWQGVRKERKGHYLRTGEVLL